MLGEDHIFSVENSFIEVDLEDFSIYRPHRFVNRRTKDKGKEEKPLANEFMSLHDINRSGEKLWLMDGIIRYGQKRQYVQGVPFEILSIGGYEDLGLDSIKSDIWIQSVNGKRLDIWYRLKTPALEYKRYHQPFIWMVNLAKHMIDYMNHHDNVSLCDFRSRFACWIQGVHGSSSTFSSWLSDYGDLDFRRAVASHATFLYHQATQLDQIYGLHPLWGQIEGATLNAVFDQSKIYQQNERLNGPTSSFNKPSSKIQNTIVTPFVFKCFQHLPWAKFLEVQSPAAGVGKTDDENCMTYRNKIKIPQERVKNQKIISIGEVVAIRTDQVTDWKHNDQLWYGYVHQIRDTKKGQALDILWLYRPSDTACQKMRYPFSKELFLSGHCNCGDRNIYVSEVVSKPKVAFFGRPESEAEFFVRQKYVGNEAAWVTLQSSDFQCAHKGPTEVAPEYRIGDTLLVALDFLGQGKVLEPVELVQHHPLGRIGYARVRRLPRRRRDFGDENAEPNELVYSQSLEDIAVQDIFRRCHIRFYTKSNKERKEIPAQYRRQGSGDFYYITSQTSHGSLSPLEPLTSPWPSSMNQGWDPTEVLTFPPVMRGLDIFCGGGNLGRGLEEGGAVEFKWAVDYSKEAIHTYRANLKDCETTKLFCGSVNDFLRQALGGVRSEHIAPVGAVDMISAGSPCQGFSSANHNRGNDQALLNMSMVASVVSFIDLYRPKYAVLENVTGMAKCGANGGEDNVFAQVLCALVGLGYQVQPFILDAWNFGSPQSRTRLFISIAAPGLTPLPNPPHSHSHPEKISSRSLGKTANGLPLGNRHWDLTPFEYITIAEATRDLPSNWDGRVDCIPFPDHRPNRQLSALNRIRISSIPRFPYGMNFIKSSILGLMPSPQLAAHNWDNDKRMDPDNKAWKRVLPHALIATVTTNCVPQDAISGAWVHWDECRCMTVMEVRRAQGYPDEEVIVGAPSQQWKIVGNSVARTVSLALGMAIRSAWLSNGKINGVNS